MHKAIYWFRNDLRLEDNPAWKKAIESGCLVYPVFIHSPEEDADWALGGASMWWLHHALVDLHQQLSGKGLRLIIRSGNHETVLRDLVRELGITEVYWSKRYLPEQFQADDRLHTELVKDDIEVTACNSSLLREPWDICSGSGQPYRVYTPYMRAFRGSDEPQPVSSCGNPVVPSDWPDSMEIQNLELLPRLDWADGFRSFWNPTRAGGLERLRLFIRDGMGSYDEMRDIPAVEGTSRLSPYLHWGQLGPREVLAAIRGFPDSAGKETFYREIVWREFAYHVLFHNPETAMKPLQPSFNQFSWREDAADLEAWKKGLTGYPIVDAGMRQLWQTGWMHNRVRMIVASFLVKHLLLPWQEGAKWFWDTLVDADLASNSLGWQWAGGCGADAAPYFRVFNPIIQGKKFDPEGHYVRKYVPELRELPKRYIHTPWETPASLQQSLNLNIGDHYPAPIIEHGEGRNRALDAFQPLRERTRK
jgi:deoxyribodipyrimidine photo-lyase